MSTNTEIYDLVCNVPKYAKKPIRDGRLKGKTDISTMWRIQVLTEVFGPCGFGWKYEIVDQRLEPGADGVVKAFVDINLYVKWGDRWSEPIPGIGGNDFVAKESKGHYTSDECFKKALSDAISVAAKALGVGASVYMGSDDSKYSVPRDAYPARPADTRIDRAPAPAAPPAPPPAEDRGALSFYCECCGKELTPYIGTRGQPVSLRAHAERSMKRFGKILCLDCMPTD
ncbi:MAG: hypothetical protein IK095_03390 [Oscillospiraceae bacterium]|nr:hypothetical protein [Oscillospiraceae bacterium]